MGSVIIYGFFVIDTSLQANDDEERKAIEQEKRKLQQSAVDMLAQQNLQLAKLQEERVELAKRKAQQVEDATRIQEEYAAKLAEFNQLQSQAAQTNADQLAALQQKEEALRREQENINQRSLALDDERRRLEEQDRLVQVQVRPPFFFFFKGA